MTEQTNTQTPVHIPTYKMNNLAIASFTLAFFPIFAIPYILSFIFGHIALVQIKHTNQAGKNLATAALVFNYLILLIIILACISIRYYTDSIDMGTLIPKQEIISPFPTQ